MTVTSLLLWGVFFGVPSGKCNRKREENNIYIAYSPLYHAGQYPDNLEESCVYLLFDLKPAEYSVEGSLASCVYIGYSY